MRKALNFAASRDRRSVASLLEKIIADYLNREGVSWEEDRTHQDRREHSRKDVSLPARLIIQKNPEVTEQTEVLVEKISRGGAYVTYTNGHSSPWKLESEIRLIVRIPSSAAPLELACGAVRVIRDAQKVGVGLQYRGLLDEDLALIHRYLRNRPPGSSTPPDPSLN